MILTRVRPRLYLPAIEFIWGCMVIAYLGVNNKAGLLAIRLFLGVVEAGFFVSLCTGLRSYRSVACRGGS
jgi:hypothetical protein